MSQKTFGAYKIDKTAPTLEIDGDLTEVTHEDIILTVNATDSLSGIKRIKDPDDKWANTDSLNYTVKENGEYTFVAEDHAGNTTTKSVIVDNIDKTISFEKPDISNFENFVLQEQGETITTNISPIVIKDWRDGANQWKLDVSASQMKLENEEYWLPKGSITLKSVSTINQLNGDGELPMKGYENNKVIDDGKVTLVEGNSSRGEYKINFSNNALELFIDPTTAKEGKYKTTLTWDLISAP